MASGIIYQVASDGTLTRMVPSKPANEDEIQRLIAEHPEMVTGSEDHLLLIERESAISDRSDGSGRWSLDHLFVSREGRPVLVEVKRASNTQLRREVVGQILEYAANASVYWTADTMRAALMRTAGGVEAAAQRLEEFLTEERDVDDAIDIDAFWHRVESNLRAGDMLLVIVADSIPRELGRIVEFMNEQMRATVQAVELGWYASAAGMRTLLPRIIGATERASANKPTADSTETAQYWQQLKRAYPNLVRGNPWTRRVQDFFPLHASNPKISIGCRFIGKDLRLHAYFDQPGAAEAYAVTKAHRAQIEATFGDALEWDDMEGYHAARIVYWLRNADMRDYDAWDRQHAWINERGFALADAITPFLPIIEEAIKTPGPNADRSIPQ